MRRREFLLTPLFVAPVAWSAPAAGTRLSSYLCESQAQLDTLARSISSSQPDALILEATAAAHLPQLVVVSRTPLNGQDDACVTREMLAPSLEVGAQKPGANAQWGGAPAPRPSSSSAQHSNVARALSPQDSSRHTLYEVRTYEQCPSLEQMRDSGVAPMPIDQSNDAWTMLAQFRDEAHRNAAWTHYAWLTRKTNAPRVREIVVAREWRG